MSHKYDDIINLPRHVSKKRTPMAIQNRAAQFSPFAALTGHGEAVEETARITQRRIALDKYMKEELNNKLQVLIKEIKEKHQIKITYFTPDETKEGGNYIDTTGTIKKIDDHKKLILMDDKTLIPIDEIISLEGQVFHIERATEIDQEAYETYISK